MTDLDNLIFEDCIVTIISCDIEETLKNLEYFEMDLALAKIIAKDKTHMQSLSENT